VRPKAGESRLLELIGDISGLLDLGEFRRGLPKALLRAVPARWASLNEVGPARVATIVEPHLEEPWPQLFAELAHENPIYQRWQRTHDGRPYRFSDVATREQLEATELYRRVYAPLGIEHQIAFTLPCRPDRVLAAVLSRSDRDFADAERDFLDRARPYLIQAYRNAVAYSELRERSPAGLEQALIELGLTLREAEVVRLVASGGSNRDIAAGLGVTDRTIQKHLERAFRKLGVRNRSEAASRAWQLAAARAEDAW
jgi:DNA-binding CsgD family transcriptional regulator